MHWSGLVVFRAPLGDLTSPSMASASTLVKFAGAATGLAMGCSILARRDPINLTGRVVLITGAAAGVGQLCAIAFAKQGCNLVLWDLSEEGLSATKARVLEVAPECRCLTQRVDVSDRSVVYRAAEDSKAWAAPSHVSILVNNAGIQSGKPFLESDDERMLAVFRVNALAHLWTCKAFLPPMLEAKLGHIVAVASAAGLIAAPGMIDYAASKFAAVGFAEGLRKELRLLHGDAVRTSLVCPAAITTELFKGFKQPVVPPLQPEFVADQIVDAVRYRRDMLVLPKSSDTSLVNALLPVAASDALWRWLGHGAAMSTVDTSHAEKVMNSMLASKL